MQSKHYRTLALCCALLLMAGTAHAHSLWVSLFESHTHEPGHLISTIGWGHMPPVDDLLSSPNGSTSLEDYFLLTPDGRKIPLGLPSMTEETQTHAPYAAITSGDIGTRKIALREDSPKGTYQVMAINKTGYFTRYKNKTGRMRMAAKSMDSITDASEVMESVRFTMNAKAYYTVGQWQQPRPAGFDLEIIPENDLTTLRAGDMASFDISFMGKPVTTDSNAIHYMTLTSDTYGGPDGFFLSSYIMNGKAGFRIPAAGHWVANVYIAQEVTPDGPLKALIGKCKKAFAGATVSFTALP